jgi:hypothetical protein
MSPEQEYLLFAQRQALQEAARAHPAEDAMRGIDLDGKGRGTRAHGALVAVWLESRHEEARRPFSLLEAIPNRKAH